MKKLFFIYSIVVATQAWAMEEKEFKRTTCSLLGAAAIKYSAELMATKKLHEPIMLGRKSKFTPYAEALSPDGTKVAACYKDGLYILNSSTGELLLQLKKIVGIGLAWSPDGARIVSACCGRGFTVLKCDTGEKEFDLFISKYPRSDQIAWSPSGKNLALSGNEIKIFNTETWEPVNTLVTNATPETLAGWSPSGEYFASGCFEGYATVWNACDWKMVARSRIHNGLISAMQWRPNSSELVSISSDSCIKVWNFQTREIMNDWQLAFRPLSVQFSPDRMHVACNLEEGRTVVVDLHAERCKIFSGQSSGWAADGSRFLFTNKDSDLMVSDFCISGQSVNQPFTFQRESNLCKVWGRVVKKDIKIVDNIKIANQNDLKKRSKASKLQEGYTLPYSTSLVDLSHSRVACSPDGQKSLYFIQGQSELKVRDFATGNDQLFESSTGEIIAAQWFADARRIVLVGKAGTIEILDSVTGHNECKNIQYEECSHSLRDIVLSPNGDQIAAALDSGKILIMDTETLQIEHVIEGDEEPSCLGGWSPEGLFFAAGGVGGTIMLWDTKNWRSEAQQAIHSRHITSLRWSPSGKYLASASSDSTIGIWNCQIRLLMIATDPQVSQPSVAWLSSDDLLINSPYGTISKIDCEHNTIETRAGFGPLASTADGKTFVFSHPPSATPSQILSEQN